MGEKLEEVEEHTAFLLISLFKTKQKQDRDGEIDRITNIIFYPQRWCRWWWKGLTESETNFTNIKVNIFVLICLKDVSRVTLEPTAMVKWL